MDTTVEFFMRVLQQKKILKIYFFGLKAFITPREALRRDFVCKVELSFMFRIMVKCQIMHLGIDLAYKYLDDNKIPYKKCGKLIVALDAEEVRRLDVWHDKYLGF